MALLLENSSVQAQSLADLLHLVRHSTSEEEVLGALQQASRRRREMGDWFRAEALLFSETGLVTHRIAREAQVRGAEAMRALLRNPRLGEQSLLLTSEALSQLTYAVAKREMGGADFAPVLGDAYQQGFLTARSPETERLRLLLPQARARPEERLNTALRTLDRLAHTVAETLARCPDLSAEALLGIPGELERGVAHGLACDLARHPSATPKLWHLLLRTVKQKAPGQGRHYDELLTALAERRDSRQDPGVRQALAARAKDPKFLFWLTVEAGEETRLLFQQLVRLGGTWASLLLEYHDFHGHHHLRLVDLSPLLEHPEADVRLRAIRHSTRVKASQPSASPLPSPRLP